ncbi:MAG: ABC transporter permease [Patescibacteria group bacterium]
MAEYQGNTIVIKPTKGWVSINLRELWRFRELFYIFSWRDFKVRYKQTIIGVLWAILQPFLMMVVFSIFFGRLAGISSNGVPYPIFVYSGLIFWNYFSTALMGASNTLTDNENIVKKIYFPRLLLPFSATITPLIDFFFALLVLVGMMVYYHSAPSLLTVVLLPLLLLLSFLAASGLGSLLSAINVRFRDVRYALPFLTQLLFFVTPVIYPISIVPIQYHWVLSLNPMTGIINTARAVFLHQSTIPYTELIYSTLVIIVLFIHGLFYFRRTEKIFADVA